ncbi:MULTISPECIES: metallophosphoesterase family protein [Maribacter]|jgi:serine/threonine protein phosphatase 1|uniref:metallophosphoesterase family protein n=1 Tax=Maribacter TaxID=252356 RepID=UPI00047BCCB3|nr:MULTISPECIES: metallophosphoesterase family protein [Maribacter]|tara:strand:- start:5819 stop:6553 length:735 start_codon:yes stop_codon:yes gene_type:complete
MNLKRTLVVGDIHSGLQALKQVLEKAAITEKDTIIFLGDYIDGWSEAVETVNYLLQLKEKYNCIYLRGNHDELCYEWLTGKADNPTWFMHGGEATSNSYGNASKETKDLHLKFYESLQNYHLDSESRLFLHAGFTNLKGIEHEYFKKTFYWDRTLWELALSLNKDLEEDHIHYPKRLKNYSEIYIGHTPVTRIGKTTPQKAANVWNIDTGAAFKGPLTVFNADTKEYWQSEPVYTFYPNENGRN